MLTLRGEHFYFWGNFYPRGLSNAWVLEYANSRTGGSEFPILLGHYSLPLGCQAIMIVNSPINGSSTNNLIISLTLLSASNGRPGHIPGFPNQSPSAFFENPLFQFPR